MRHFNSFVTLLAVTMSLCLAACHKTDILESKITYGTATVNGTAYKDYRYVFSETYAWLPNPVGVPFYVTQDSLASICGYLRSDESDEAYVFVIMFSLRQSDGKPELDHTYQLVRHEELDGVFLPQADEFIAQDHKHIMTEEGGEGVAVLSAHDDITEGVSVAGSITLRSWHQAQTKNGPNKKYFIGDYVLDFGGDETAEPLHITGTFDLPLTSYDY